MARDLRSTGSHLSGEATTVSSSLRDIDPSRSPTPGDLNYRSEWEASREISHDEAREIARRLIASHFRRTDCETARVGIPARPDYDDDLLICSYIKQQSRKDAFAPSEWQPIQTAPKDGRAVDLLNLNGRRLTDFYWDAEMRGGCWVDYRDRNEHWHNRRSVPASSVTHWSPPPALPPASTCNSVAEAL